MFDVRMTQVEVQVEPITATAEFVRPADLPLLESNEQVGVAAAPAPVQIPCVWEGLLVEQVELGAEERSFEEDLVAQSVAAGNQSPRPTTGHG